MRITLMLGLCLAIGAVWASDAGEKGRDKHDDEHVIVTPRKMTGRRAPPSLPPGAEVAVLAGDPSKSGMAFTIRAKLPDGYTVPPHWHPTDENVTVLKGTLLIGRGNKIVPKAMEELPAGSY